MAGFHAASLLVPDHPVLYGTTLAIGLVGSVAALNSGGISVPVTQLEYALGLAQNATVAVGSSPVMHGLEPAAGSGSAVSDQIDVTVADAPESRTAIPAELHLSTKPLAPETAPRVALPNLATLPQQEFKAAPQSIAAPAVAALAEPLQVQPAAAPTNASVTAQPSQSFAGAFQSIPAPSLTAAPQRQDQVRDKAASGSEASALTAITVQPDQGLAEQHKVAFAPVSAGAQTKPIDASPPLAMVQTQARPPEAAVAPAPVTSKLTATSAAQPVPSSAQKAQPQPTPAAQPLRVISSPQLRKFDLGHMHAPARTPAAALTPVTAKPGQAGKTRIGAAKDKLVDGVVFHQVTVTVAGSPAKPVAVRIGADMKPSIKVGDLLGLVSDRMDQASVNRFASAASAEEYVSLAALRAAGFNVSYNAASDSLSINTGN